MKVRSYFEFVVHWRWLRCRLSFAYPFIVFVTHLILDLKPPAKKLRISSGDEIQGNDEHNVKSADAKSSDLIEVQKGRAMKRWEEAFDKKYVDENIYNDVLEKLKIGKVPPIFHTLCRDPAKRLFLPNAFVSNGKEESGNMEISASSVEAGISSSLNDSTNLSIWKKDDFSYLDAFFATDGHGLVNVRDSVLKDDWEFDEEIAEIVTDLVNTPAEMVGQDLEVTTLQNEFLVDVVNGKNLITRSLSRGVVADCFEQSRKRSNYAIVGSPGIGKSWSLIYAFQQALLYENVCVLFCFQKEEVYWVCIRKEHRIYAWRMESKNLERFCSGLFHNSNVLVLLDPRESVDGGASYKTGNRRLIFAASNNAAHFKNVFKDTLGYERILNQFSTSELKIALKYMSPTGEFYSDDEVLTMLAYAKQVGNMPRYVQSEEGFKVISKKVKEYIQDDVEKMDSLSLLDFLRFKGTIGVEEKDSVKGAIFSLFAVGSLDEEYALVDVGYDGDAVVDGKAVVQYGTRDVMFACNYTRRQIAIAQRATLLSYDGKTADGLGSHFGHIVEDLFWMDMEKNIKMQVYELKYIEGKKDQEKVPNTIEFYFKDAVYYGKRTSLKELATTVFSKNGCKYKCRMTVNSALIDFAALGRQVFQVTVRKDHPVNRQGVRDIFIASGILKEENGMLSYSKGVQMVLNKNPNMLQKWKLKFYWVIPEGVSEIWIKKKPVNVDSIPEEANGSNAKKRKRKKTDLLDEAWMKCVDQYVAVMSPNLEHAERKRNRITL
jgi:hypothetical protein